MGLITITTGYMGSGSSAVTDLISEFSSYDVNNGSFEYIFLHCPDGVFDLEDKLLHGNNVIRSDEAITRFEKCMRVLYDTKNFWPGMYKKRVSRDFFNITEKFVNKLIDFKHDDRIYWYYQQIPDTFYLQFQLYIQRFFRTISFGKINLKTVLQYKGMRIAYPTAEEFYGNAKEFLKNFYILLGSDKHNLLLDQFLLPHNLYRLNNYFDENTRVIVVDRDPRDIFVLNKYLWLKNNCPVAYPTDALQFCNYYKKMRQVEIHYDDDRILRLHFEDLVYNYEKSLEKIKSFLNLSSEQHSKKYEKFNPNVSIKNTQVFKCYSQYSDEISIIEKKLSGYLYEFPYNVVSNINESF